MGGRGEFPLEHHDAGDGVDRRVRVLGLAATGLRRRRDHVTQHIGVKAEVPARGEPLFLPLAEQFDATFHLLDRERAGENVVGPVGTSGGAGLVDLQTGMGILHPGE